MQLTQFTDVGMRIVMRLASADDAVRPSSRALAEELSVSYAHSAKVIARLSELGVVDARRGRGGGLAITELGRRAPVGWLVRRLEGEEEAADCDGALRIACPLRGRCRLRFALREAQNAFFASLDAYTVEQLAAGTESATSDAPASPVLLTLPVIDHGRPQQQQGD